MAASRRKGIIAVIVVMMVALVAVTAILLFSSRTVSVRFETGNGPAISNIVLKVGETAERPADPVHDDPGYSFGGWYMDENYTVEFDWDMPIEQTTTVFVKWRAESFTVRVLRKTNGGFDEILYRATGDYTSTITLPTENTAEAPNEDLDPVYNFQRYNQNFIGFSYDSNADNDFSVDLLPGSTFTIPNKDTQLYAIFRGKESSFQFDSNNASGLVGDQTGYFNEYFTVPSSEGLSYKYYTFVEWNTVRDGSGESYLPGQQIKITSLNPVTLYAIWERNQVNVCVEAMGGTGSIGTDGTNLYDAGTQFDLTSIAQPIREGYRLMSYNSQPDGLGITYALDEIINLEEDDVTLYAMWAKLITVAYDYNGVESNIAMSTFTGVAGESFVVEDLPDGVVRNNFDFQGWSLDQLANDATYKAGNTFTISADYTRDVTLYAIWLGVPRTLVFDNNGGGNGNTEVNKTHGFRYQIDKKAQNIDKGYDFVGWNTQPDGKGVTYQVGDIFVIGDNLNNEGDSILFAMWEPVEFTISYYLQGGVCSFDPSANPYIVNVKYKTDITLIHAATAISREGYRFMGWGLGPNSVEPEYYDVENGTGWDISMPANNLMLFAIWEQEFTITFDSNGGSGIVSPITNVIFGEQITLPASGYTRENYTQTYWSNDQTGGEEYALGGTITFENTSQTTMYAIWQGNTRHIYVYDNLDNSNYARDIVGRYGEKMTIEYEIEITNSDLGYELAGFGENAYATVDNIRYHYGDVINAPTSESINIYAVWTKRSFEVLYELEGGSYDGSTNMNDYAVTKVYEETSYIPQLTPTREKHTFLGWCEDPNGTGTLYQPSQSFTIPSHDVIFYAIWARSYTLSFDGNGGELADPDIPVNEITRGKGSVITLNDATIGGSFQKEHYEFVCWNDRQDGLGTDYARNSTITLNQDTTLYAKWQGVQVPLSINTGSTTNITIAPTPRYGDIIDLSTRIITPPRDGLELVGFADEDDPDTVVWTTEYEVNDVNRNIIYAVWAPKTYILIIRLEGGMYDRSYEDIKMNVLFETEVDLADYSSAITQTGYKLLGFKNKQTSTMVDYALDGTFSMPAANTTIYCHWEKLAVYTFNTNMGDASTVTVKEYVVNDRDVAPTLTREYYTFIGWSQSQTATTADSGMYAGDQFVVTALVDLTYYAVWQGDTRTVILDANGAVGVVSQQITTQYGAALDLSNRTLTRSDTNGYEFAGWSTTSGTENAVDTIVGDYIVESPTAEVTLYAVWARRNFTIRFYNDGKQTRALVRQYEAVIELTGTDFELAQKGYTFLGWAESDLETDTSRMYTSTKPFTVPDADVNLYAIWDPQEVTIRFMNDDTENPDVQYVGATLTNGGSFTIIGLKDLKIQMPSNYQSAGNGMYRTRYKFTGWKLEVNGVLQDTLYKENDLFTVFQEKEGDEIYFFAQWEINKIEVLIDANGGLLVIDEYGSTANNQVVKITENDYLTLPKLTEISRSGYRLLYFEVKRTGDIYNASTDANPVTVAITTSLLQNNIVTITAIWIPQYTVEFAINVPAAEITSGLAGGTMATQSIDSGIQISLPECGFTRTNYVFASWNTNALGTGVTFNPGDPVQVSSNITYYAIWQGNARTVEFNFNGNKADGSSDIETVSTFYGETLDLSNYQRENANAEGGLMLEGWKKNISDTTLFKRYSEKYVVEGTDDDPIITLYASWAARTFEITFDANGGEFSDVDGAPTTQITSRGYGSEVTISREAAWIPSNPTKNTQAYSFVGWSATKTTSYNGTTSEDPSVSLTPAALDKNLIYTPGVEGDNKCHTFLMPAYNVVLYAIWKPEQWTIVYVNETSEYKRESQAYGTTITLSTGPSKTDHLFKSWDHTIADGSTVSYLEGEMFEISFDNMTEDEKKTKTINLYATFTPQSVRIRILANDGMFTDGSEQKIIDSFVGREITLPKIQEDEGSEYQLRRAYSALIGFSTDPGAAAGSLNLQPGAKYTVPSLSSDFIFGGELILYAQWTNAEAYIYGGDDPDMHAYYATLSNALTAASDGDTVYILTNSTISAPIEIKVSVSLMFDDALLLQEDSGSRTITISRASGFTDNMFVISPNGNFVIGYEDRNMPLSLTINGNKNVTNAAAIFNVQGQLSIYDGVTITNARGLNGGAIYVNGNAATVNLKYCTFKGNQANNGGAIYVEKGEVFLDEGLTLDSNTAVVNGGAIYNKGSLYITSETGVDKGIIIISNSAEGNGGAFYNDGQLQFTLVTIGSESTNGKNAADYGGAIYNGTTGKLNLTQVVFINNEAYSEGGAIFNAAPTDGNLNASIISCEFGQSDSTGNSAATGGGAICNFGVMEIVTDEDTGVETRFIGNKTTSQGASGGAIYNAGGTLTLNAVTFTENSVGRNSKGGALSVINGEVNLGVTTDNDSIITFTKNSSGNGEGLAIYIEQGTLNFNKVDIYDNKYEGTAYQESYNGGTVYVGGGTLNINSAEIHENTTTANGGAIFASAGTININNANIYSNQATNGGAIYAKQTATINLNKAEIYSNAAVAFTEDTPGQGLGGAIYTSSAGVSLLGGTIGRDGEGNSAIYGGAVYATAQLTINGATIAYNLATENGGAIWTEANLILITGDFKYNTAQTYGGAIYTSGNSIVKFQDTSLSNSKFTRFEGNDLLDEDGAGYGIYAVNKVEIQGTILFMTTIGKDDIFLNNLDDSGNILEVYLVYKGALTTSCRINITCENTVVGTKLVDMTNDAYAKTHLKYFMYDGNAGGVRAKGQYIINGNYSATIGEGSEPDYYNSLRAAYLAAQEGDIISLERDIDLYEDLRTDPDIDDSADYNVAFDITKTVTIKSGAEYTISRGAMTGYMFDVSNGATFSLGNTAGTNDGSKLYLDGGNSDLVEIDASQSIINVQATSTFNLYITAYLQNNKADKGGAITNAGTVVLNSGVITTNTAYLIDEDENLLGQGGAIYNTGVLRIGNATISENYSNAYGGAIYNENGTVEMNTAEAAISTNTATISGGGIYTKGGTVTLKAGSITLNKTEARDLNGDTETPGGAGISIAGGATLSMPSGSTATITNNESKANGGGIALYSGIIELVKATISDNTAGSFGGGIYVVKTAETDTHTLNITHNTNVVITKNNGKSGGGGLAVVGATLTITNYLNLYGNTAKFGGGVVVSSTEAYNAVLTFNSANITIGKASDPNTATDGGGVYVFAGASFVVSYMSAIQYNNATGNGGGIYNDGTLIAKNVDNNQNIEFKVLYNTAGQGGGIFNNTNGTVSLTAFQINSNTATSTLTGGGGIYNKGTMTLIEYNACNSYVGYDANTPNIATNGGAIYNEGTLYTDVDRSNMADPTANAYGYIWLQYNRVTDYGGGIYQASGIIEFHYVYFRMYYNEQTNTVANAGGGGGMAVAGGTVNAISKYNYQESKWIDYVNLYFHANTATGYGGGLIMIGGEMNYNHSYMTSNRTYASGGAIAVISGDLTFEKERDDQNGFRVYVKDNIIPSTGHGSDMFLNEPVTVRQQIGIWSGYWNGTIYLNNTRSYLIFDTYEVYDTSTKQPKKDSEGKVVMASHYVSKGVKIEPHEDGLVDGRKLAAFKNYVETEKNTYTNEEGATIEETIAIEKTYAETYYTYFDSLQLPSDSVFGVDYQQTDGVGEDVYSFVVLKDPVAMNVSKNPDKYYATIAAATEEASDGDCIEILVSHTVRTTAYIYNKSLYFGIKSDIILTRADKFYYPIFMIVNNDNSVQKHVTFNHTHNSYGWTGTNRLTLDGNRDAKTNKSTTHISPLINCCGTTLTLDQVKTYIYYLTSYMWSGSTYIRQSRMPANVDLTLNGCTLQNNKVYRSGAALTYYGYSGDYSSRAAYRTGGAKDASILSINNCTFDNNKTTCGYYNSYSEGNRHYYTNRGGGAIHAESGRLSISDSNFTNNYSQGHGGAILAIGQADYYYSSSHTNDRAIYIARCNFDNNYSYGNGGAICLLPIYNRFQLGDNQENSTRYINFTNNESRNSGGAIYYNRLTPSSFYSYYADSSIDNWTYSFNNATEIYEEYAIRTGTSDPSYNVALCENIIPLMDSKTVTEYMIVNASAKFDGNNSVSSNGGAIYAVYGGLYLDTASIRNNSAQSHGGGVYTDYWNHIKNSTFDGNTARASYGGGLYLGSNSVGNKFRIHSNWQHTSLRWANNSTGRRDAYYEEHYGDKIRIDGCTFTNNYAGAYGGGFYAGDCAVFLNNTTVSGNEAKNHGGGIYFGVKYSDSKDKSLYFANNIISNNKSGNYGGGIYLSPVGARSNSYVSNTYDHIFTVWQSTFTGNEARYKGGGIYNYDCSMFYNCDISENKISDSASQSGGAGIWAYYRVELYGTTTVARNQITANSKTTSSGGAGIWGYASRVHVNDVYTCTTKSYSTATTTAYKKPSVTEASPVWTAYNSYFSSSTNANILPFSYYNWERVGEITGTNANWAPVSNNSGNMTYGGKTYNKAATNNCTIAGNTCNGQGMGDGIYYYNATGYRLYLSGSPVISDNIFMTSTNTKTYVYGYLNTSEERVFTIYYNTASVNSEILGVNKNFSNFTASTLAMFNISHPANMSINCTNLGTSGYKIGTLANNTILFRVYDNSYAYQASSNSAAYISGSTTEYQMTTSYSNTSYFPTTPSRGDACLDGMANKHYKDVTAVVGQNFKTVFDQLNISKTGSTFYRFVVYYSSGGLYTNYSVGSAIPTLSTYTNAGVSTYGGVVVLMTSWKDTLSKVTITKYLDNKTTTNGRYSSPSQSWDAIYDSVNGTREYIFKIYTGQSFGDIVAFLEEDNALGYKVNGVVVDKFYYEGYTFSHMMIEQDRQVYEEDDVYPYVSDMTLYLVYFKTEYNLEYTLGTSRTVEVDGVDYNVGGGNWVYPETNEETGEEIKVRYQQVLHNNKIALLSGALIQKDGCELAGWYGSDGKIYNITGAYTITQLLSFEPVWAPVPFTLRVYYNYPTGGASFSLYSVNGDTSILNALTTFNPSITGYTLDGFAFDAQGTVRITDADKMPSHEQIIYALWAPIDVTVTFLNPDYTVYTTMTVKFGQDFQLPATLPSTAAKKFWTNRGSAMTYAPGATYIIETLVPAELQFIAGVA